ncbi:MAG: hypothetical protein KGP35_04965 [Bacteroidetes bacterium]|nr:hypothetical protein [Bacteroidota bacterium]
MRQVNFKLSIIILVSFILCSQHIHAQKPQQPGKIKPPKVNVYWGFSKGGPLSREAFVSLLDSSIQVISEKKEQLAISRAMLVYKSKDQFEDEKGKLKVQYNAYMNEIRNENKVPEKWKPFLSEEIKSGDIFLIAEIHVRDKQGYIFNAPDLKITIE